MRYYKLPCKLCGQMVSSNGAARYSHAGKHIAEGEVEMKLDPLTNLWHYVKIGTDDDIYGRKPSIPTSSS